MRNLALCLAVLAGLALTEVAFSQEGEPSGDTRPPDAVSHSDLSVIGVKFVKNTYRTVGVDDPLIFEVQIVNQSATHVLHISEVTLEPSYAYARTRRAYLPKAGDEIRSRQQPTQMDWLAVSFRGEVEIRPNEFKTVPINLGPTTDFLEAWQAWKTFSIATLSSQSVEWATIRVWLAKLKFVSGEQDFTVNVFYHVDAGAIQHETATKTLRVQSSTSTVLLGALVGCLLATLFRASYRVSRHFAMRADRTTPPPAGRWVRRCWSACTRLVCSLVTALIATLLCQILKDVPNFPVKVTADSVSGGLLLGLISYRLGSWMNEFLGGSRVAKEEHSTPASMSPANPAEGG